MDLEKKQEEFLQQCESGDVRGCHSLAEWYQLIKRDDAAALKLFRRACDPQPGDTYRRYAPSCFSVASYLVTGNRDNAQGVAFFEKACSAGSVEACANLGIIYRRGLQGVATNAAKAEAFCDQACAGGDGKSCLFAGAARKQAGDGPAALHLFEKACLLGNPWGCSNAHIMLARGDGVPADAARAQRLREMAEELAKSLGLKLG
jgi:TPR repeat protein